MAISYGTQLWHSVMALSYGTQLRHSVKAITYATQLRHSITVSQAVSKICTSRDAHLKRLHLITAMKIF